MIHPLAPDHAPATPAPAPPAGGLVTGRTLLVLCLACLAVAAKTLVDLYLKSVGRGGPSTTDIETFWLVGWLIRQGRLTEAYDATAFFAVQAEVLQTESFMPYTYPPQFNFLTAAMGLMPVWLAYALMLAAGLALYAVALRRLSPGQAGFAFVMVFPAILVNIRTGQNGLLLAGLLALAVQGLLAGGAWRGGLALGLAAIKPHMALGVGAAALLMGRWRLAAVALATGLVTLGAALLAFGTDQLHLIPAATAQAMGFLRDGAYPLHRMVSVYALFRSLGASADLAMAAQAALAVAVLAGLALLALRRAAPHILLAAALTAPLLISPYAYDYDMALAGIALALVAPALLARSRPAERIALLAGAWLACGWGIPTAMIAAAPDAGQAADLPSIQAGVNLLMLLAIARILSRPEPATGGHPA